MGKSAAKRQKAGALPPGVTSQPSKKSGQPSNRALHGSKHASGKASDANLLLTRALAQHATLADQTMKEFDSLEKCASTCPCFAKAMVAYKKRLKDALQCNTKVLPLLLEKSEAIASSEGSEEASAQATVTYDNCIGSSYNSPGMLWSHLVKDWTAQAPDAWGVVYRRISEALQEHVVGSSSNTRVEGKPPLVVVPGSGQGRLVFEVAKAVQLRLHAIESSRLQLLVTDFIWNRCKKTESISFYPFLDESANNLSEEGRLMQCRAPDVLPQEYPEVLERVTFSSGDFVGFDFKGEKADAVVTCFVMDCFEDIVAGVQKIHTLLNPGGCWINVGPLEFHAVNMRPTMAHVKLLAEELGFTFLAPQLEDEIDSGFTKLNLPYFNRPGALHNFQISEAAWFVATKNAC
eukprot:gene13549-19419_t